MTRRPFQISMFVLLWMLLAAPPASSNPPPPLSVLGKRIVEARWGEVGKNVVEAESETNEAMCGAGSAIDLGKFRFSRQIAPGKAGGTKMPIGPDDLF